jgi:D-lactate dehydrogenase (cytochrome)
MRDIRLRLGGDAVIAEPARLLPYESDALPRFRETPAAVILPRATEEVAWVVTRLAEVGIPLTPRGAGTGLSGGAVAAPGGVVLGTSRMNRILDLDPQRRLARVQAGVVNADLSAAAAPHGLHYAPDPSSQTACTLGGNVGENAGGPHCLKYGVTTRYVSGLTVVTGRGEVVELGGAQRIEGLDLTGIFVGSEGRMGLATELELRLIPRPRAVRTFLAVFPDTELAGAAVSSIIAAGLLPAAMEIMDRGTIRAVESSIYAAGYPTDAGAVLVVEFDGTDAGLDAEADRAHELCRAAGSTELRRARNEEERQALWQGRKKAYGAFGRITPDVMVQDATVPRSALPSVLRRIDAIGREHGLVVANVFHAGDGNLHPKILFDRRDPELVERVERASREMMQACVDAGGTITGEHGVGLDKRGYMPLVHSPEELRLMARAQRAFDPAGVWNPGKVLPEDLGGDPDEGVRETRLGDTSGPGSARGPSGAVRPASAKEVQKILASASTRGIRTRIVETAGDGPDPDLDRWNGLLVETSGLPGGVSHSPSDLTVTVGGSERIGELQALLLRGGQWLPLDVPGSEGWTVGGAVARGLWGPLAPTYGRLRDLVLGAELVTGDGRHVRLGGQVMKNVAGFDLIRGVSGSRGRWGVINRVTFRLAPVPERHRVLVWKGDAHAMTRLSRRVAVHPILPASVIRSGGPEGHSVLVRLLGSGATVEAESGELERDFPGAQAWDSPRSDGPQLQQDPLARVVSREAGCEVLEVRPGAMDFGTLAPLLADVGSGVVHHYPLWDVWRVPLAEGAPEGVRVVRETVRAAAGDAAVIRGRIAGEPEERKDRRQEERVALEDAVFRVFDPAGILA